MPVRTVAGVDTYWTRTGNGRRKAVLLHCSLASSRAWGPLSAVLDTHLDMTLLDFPGHGKTADWDETRDYQDLCTEIAQDFLPEGACDLIGHSFGATVALRLAHAMPERVRSLTLIEPVFFAAAYADRPDLRVVHDRMLGDFSDALDRGDMHAAAAHFTAVWGDGRPWEALPDEMRHKMAARIHMVPASHAALNTDRQGMLLPGGLQHVTCPVLLVEGSESPDLMSLINDGLARRLTDARRVVISGAGHMVPITHAAQVAREIWALLQETAVATPTRAMD
ncbi:alpha/beta hydrolase [Primorskyibacter aestuariivivens]|uniref:alpha/beta fold hydrolase n=1 Tax=Primorskyibacter aestuariivivens TaxID=1888912 RepID=UPI00230023B4|nr:alpha/beta hydrolase [Primorskyibacter aestuariivivens]MDA7429999.1 alpha/beta hydrolase [Primorskyibacter aestuariivivens]